LPAHKISIPRPDTLALAVFTLALAIRALYLFDIRTNPFFDSPVIDAQFYRDLGSALARGEGTGRAPFMMPPLYPLLLAGLFKLAGEHLLLAHVVQILLGAASAGLACLLGCRLGGKIAGLLAGFLVATSRALIFVEGDLLATPLSVCLDLLFLLFLLRGLDPGGRRREFVFAGLAAGLSALARPSNLLAVVAVLIWLAFRLRRRAAVALIFLAGLVTIVPVTVHNLRASDELVWISANGGINFYIGNNPEMERTVSLRPGPEYRRLNDLPLREAGAVRAGARDRWFYHEGFRFWREHPLLALRQTFTKAVLLLGNHEIMRDFDFYYFARHFSRLLRLPGWNFAMLLALATVGLFLARRGMLAETWVAIYLAAYAAGIVLFFVSARYRAPLLPILAVYAGMGLEWLWGQVRRRSRPALVRAGILMATVLAISLVDWFGVNRVDEAEAIFRIGTAYQNRGAYTQALQTYAEVLRRDPQHALAAAHAAQCEQKLGHKQQAVTRYEELLEKHPDYVEPMVNLANLAWGSQDGSDARHYFQLAVATDPWFAQAHGYFGMYLLSRGEAVEAVAELQRALDLDPSWEVLRLALASALVANGKPKEALRELQKASEVMPRSDASELVRGDALLALGRAAEAKAAWQAGLRLNPRNDELRRRMQGATNR
jgi:tetratricopeptide (TPR) repeat protein